MPSIENIKKIIIIGIIVLLVLIVIISSIKTIPTGFVGVKSRFGAVQDTMLHEGINLKLPFVEQIHKIDCRVKKSEVEEQAASKDLQTVKFRIAVNYNVNRESANQLFKTVGMDYENIILIPSILEAIKGTTAQYTAEELITKRQEVSDKMTESLASKIEGKGFQVIDFNVIDLEFSPEYNEAVEKKQVIEQQTKAAQYELEKAKVENERAVVNAKAQAEVMALQNAQITDKTLELKRIELQEKMIEKWNGQLPTYTSDNIPMFNIGNR